MFLQNNYRDKESENLLQDFDYKQIKRISFSFMFLWDKFD